LLFCDSEKGDSIWIRKGAVALYPFQRQSSSDPNFTEKFRKREAHLDTPAFQEAIQLAEMYADESNSHRGDCLKLLKLGYLGRHKCVALHQDYVRHRQQCEETKKQSQDSIHLNKQKRKQYSDSLRAKAIKKANLIENTSCCAQLKNLKYPNLSQQKSPASTLSSKHSRKKSVPKLQLTKPKQKTRKQNPVAVISEIQSSTLSQANDGVTSPVVFQAKPHNLESNNRKSHVAAIKKKISRPTIVASSSPAQVGLHKFKPSSVSVPSKKGKHNDFVIDAASQPSSSFSNLCKHNCTAYNCLKCIRSNQSYSSFKLPTVDDGLDDSV
jgi:hypothetical protein